MDGRYPTLSAQARAMAISVILEHLDRQAGRGILRYMEAMAATYSNGDWRPTGYSCPACYTATRLYTPTIDALIALYVPSLVKEAELFDVYRALWASVGGTFPEGHPYDKKALAKWGEYVQ